MIYEKKKNEFHSFSRRIPSFNVSSVVNAPGEAFNEPQDQVALFASCYGCLPRTLQVMRAIRSFRNSHSEHFPILNNRLSRFLPAPGVRLHHRPRREITMRVRMPTSALVQPHFRVC